MHSYAGENIPELIQQNSGIIYKICNAYCADCGSRQDLAQEILYQLLKTAKNYNGSTKFTTWMYRVALNTAITFYRAGSKQTGTVSIDETKVDVADNSAAENDNEENLALLQQFISGLKELDKALMVLYLEARPYSEIGEITGITETNVATRIGRIKEKLKQKFLQHNKL